MLRDAYREAGLLESFVTLLLQLIDRSRVDGVARDSDFALLLIDILTTTLKGSSANASTFVVHPASTVTSRRQWR